MREIQIIRGGWRNVPDNLKCKTHLKEMGLVPKNKDNHVAVVWNSYDWIKLYDVSDCREKKKPSPKQLEALKRGRDILKKSLKCSQCGESMFFKRDMIECICINCYQENQYKIEEQKYIDMIEEGENFFKKYFVEDFLILDSETTGLYNAEIIELSIINKNGDVLFDSLFKPKHPIPEDVIRLHGIDNNMVIDAPTWKDKWTEIKSLLETKKILIYNADFDVSMIANSCANWNINDLPSINTECVMKNYTLYHGSERWVSLSDASGYTTKHRALSDCYSVLNLLQNTWSELGLIKVNEDENSFARNN